VLFELDKTQFNFFVACKLLGNGNERMEKKMQGRTVTETSNQTWHLKMVHIWHPWKEFILPKIL